MEKLALKKATGDELFGNIRKSKQPVGTNGSIWRPKEVKTVAKVEGPVLGLSSFPFLRRKAGIMESNGRAMFTYTFLPRDLEAESKLVDDVKKMFNDALKREKIHGAAIRILRVDTEGKIVVAVQVVDIQPVLVSRFYKVAETLTMFGDKLAAKYESHAALLRS